MLMSIMKFRQRTEIGQSSKFVYFWPHTERPLRVKQTRMQFTKVNVITGWVAWLISSIVYILTVEPTTSLWDCGEFIAAAYKLQVVHPPGAPFFLLLGRMFAFVGDIMSSDPSNIAYMVNLMSGLSTSFGALFGFWAVTGLAKAAMFRDGSQPTMGETIALMGAGMVAALTISFAPSIWFSGVEGEVYALSFFFTTLVFWAMVKWYGIENDAQADRWLVFVGLMMGLSIGVHLLSLLTLPALGMLYYFKKYNNTTLKGTLIAAAGGFGLLVIINYIFIPRVTAIAAHFDMFTVNTLGFPFNVGFMLFYVLLGGALVYAVHFAQKTSRPRLQRLILFFGMVVLGFTSYSMIIIRGNASPPISMNTVDNPFKLVSYLNREQYGERPLLYGPHYLASPINVRSSDRYGKVGNRYEVVEQRSEAVYADRDKMFLPRMGHAERAGFYEPYRNPPGSTRPPTMGENLSFMFKYQVNWMYWRYFFWNFSGRQNAEQGFQPWDSSKGNWITGIKPLDNMRLYNHTHLTTTMKNDPGRSPYYLIPFIFGILGLIWQYRRSRKGFYMLMVLFVMTGLAIVFFSNQPPREPRERDYVLAGSMFTYALWIGMGVLALFEWLRKQMSENTGAIVASLLVLSAPVIMGVNGWGQYSRANIYAARDYAINFLESLEPEAIIFTYGDNDTYPLWYVQEVEGIRTDVRVVNLSLLAVDWYIEQLRRRTYESPPINFSIPQEELRGNRRNSMLVFSRPGQDRQWTIQEAVEYMGSSNPLPLQGGQTTESHVPSSDIIIPVDRQRVIDLGIVTEADSADIVDHIPFPVNRDRIIKDEVALMDILANNLWERPIYFAVTVLPSKVQGLRNYLRLEGLALRVVPVRNTGDQQFGLVGAGSVDADKIQHLVYNKFRWGNFDNKKLFVDESYSPAVQSLRFMFTRTVKELIARNRNDEALNLLDYYFDRFPHFNFPYDYSKALVIMEYSAAGDMDRGAEHLRILANETAENFAFLDSQSPRRKSAEFEMPIRQVMQTMQIVQNLAGQLQDEQTKNEIMAIIEPYTGRSLN